MDANLGGRLQIYRCRFGLRQRDLQWCTGWRSNCKMRRIGKNAGLILYEQFKFRLKLLQMFLTVVEDIWNSLNLVQKWNCSYFSTPNPISKRRTAMSFAFCYTLLQNKKGTSNDVPSVVTRTGIEPVLPPWKGGVLTSWPPGRIGGFNWIRTSDTAGMNRML